MIYNFIIIYILSMMTVFLFKKKKKIIPKSSPSADRD